MAPGRRTPPEKVEEVKALSVAFDAKTIAQKTGIKLRTVYAILQRKESPVIEQERAQRAQRMRGDIWAKAQETVEQEIQILKGKERMLLEHLTDEKCSKARATELTTAYGTLFDKRRLLQGESTSNEARHVRVIVVHRDGHEEEADPEPSARSSATQEEAGEVENLEKGQNLEDNQEPLTE
jgi:hypothetical protein